MCDFLPPLLQFDLDGDGAITSDELRNAMIKLLGEQTSRNEIEAVVREADNNGDGTVDFEGEILYKYIYIHTHIHSQKPHLVFFYSFK